MNIVY